MLIVFLEFWRILILIYYTHSLKVSLWSDYFWLKYDVVVACRLRLLRHYWGVWGIIGKIHCERNIIHDHQIIQFDMFYLSYFMGHYLLCVIFGEEDACTSWHYKNSDFWLFWRRIDGVIITSNNSWLFLSPFWTYY